MLLGAVVLSVGYGLMVVPGQSVWFLFCALGVVVVGNGLFKSNAGNMVRKIYEGDDSRIDSAFTIYYMAVNLGAMISQLLTPWLKDYVNENYRGELGWHIAFAVCAVGLLLGLANYALMRRAMHHIGSEPDERPPRGRAPHEGDVAPPRRGRNEKVAGHQYDSQRTSGGAPQAAADLEKPEDRQGGRHDHGAVAQAVEQRRGHDAAAIDRRPARQGSRADDPPDGNAGRLR